MTREIKFRVWDGEKMHFPEYYIFNSTWRDTNYSNDEKRVNWSAWHFMGEDRDKCGDQLTAKIMQYTGLKDKNGTEIYEGDIVETHSGFNWRVKWENNGAKFYGVGLFNSKARINMHKISKGIIIGNIYENPEQLTKKNYD